MADTRTKILVAGLGSIGKRHARLISPRTDTQLMLCDPVQENMELAVGQLAAPPLSTFADYGDALAARPDIVIIATPNRLHVPMGIQAIKAGCDVLVEKPISDELTDGRKLVDAANQAGRLLRIGYMLRHDPGLLHLRQFVHDGRIGNLVGGRSMIGTYITLLNAVSPDRDKRPNSLIVDYTHELDFVRWLFGNAKSVLAAGATVGERELKPTPNLFQMIYKMQSGALVSIHMDYLQHPQRRSLELFGDQGTIAYDMQNGEIQIFDYGKETRFERINVGDVMHRVDDLYRKQLDNFLADRIAIAANGTVDENDLSIARVTGEDGLAALIWAEAAITAASIGKAVAIA